MRLWRRTIRFWWQRRTRGWDDSDLWSLDYTILRFTLPRLRVFKTQHGGVSAALVTDDGDLADAQRAWEAALAKMVRAIELFLEHDGCFFDEPALRAEFDEGWALFTEHFFSLWD